MIFFPMVFSFESNLSAAVGTRARDPYRGIKNASKTVKEVVLMGGGYHVGNWSAVAEFNVKVDPEAAHIVFNESWPLTMVGLDLMAFLRAGFGAAEVGDGHAQRQVAVDFHIHWATPRRDHSGVDEVRDCARVVYSTNPGRSPWWVST